jgi:hypothetical protein
MLCICIYPWLTVAIGKIDGERATGAPLGLWVLHGIRHLCGALLP